MNRRELKQHYATLWEWLRRRWKSLFPKPAEVRLLQILGGSVIVIGSIRRNGRPLTITLSRGRLLRSERFRRSVIDDQGMLANDVRWAIAIQGKDYERDVIAAYEQDEQLQAAGWRVRWIPEAWLWTNPSRVRKNVLQFLS